LLCREKGVTISALCLEAGASRGALTDLKMGRIKSLSPKTLDAVAKYFDVSIDFLLGRPPFDFFALIERDRDNFFGQILDDPEEMKFCYGIDRDDPASATLQSIIEYIGSNYKAISMGAEGEWNFEWKDSIIRGNLLTGKKNPPAEAGDTGAGYSDEVRAIADDIMGLSPDRQEIARTLVASLKLQQQAQPQ